MAIRFVRIYTGDDGESHVSEGAVDHGPAGAVTVSFEESRGERFTRGPGDVLLAEDTTGGGHRWRLVDDEPWRRVFVAPA